MVVKFRFFSAYSDFFLTFIQILYQIKVASLYNNIVSFLSSFLWIIVFKYLSQCMGGAVAQ